MRKFREEHWNWKGGTFKHNGYVFILMQEHPNCQSGGYVKRCRLLVENSIGRKLSRLEVVHHINGVKDDDRIENLEYFADNGEHISKTRKGHRSTPRKYNHCSEVPEYYQLGEKVVVNRKIYFCKKCSVCLKLFWTKYRTERKMTETCGKPCFIEFMEKVNHGIN